MRTKTAVLGSLLAAGLLALVATAQPWWRAAEGQVRVAFTGTETTGGLSQALALVGLAGTLLVLALKVRGRRVVGMLLALTGLVIIGLGVGQRQPAADIVRTRMRQVSLADSYIVTATVWNGVFAAAGLLLVCGALALVVRAAQWPRGADRFRRGGVSAPAQDPGRVVDGDSAVWDALDAGLDPTVVSGEGGASSPGDSDLPRSPGQDA